MIGDERIEEAASIYGTSNGYSVIGPDGRMSLKPELENAFEAGAKWAINEFLKDLWHPNTEEPDKSKSDIITLGFYNDAYLQFKESIIWNKESWRHSISRNHIIEWAYLSDILPRKEEKNNDSRRVCKT